MNVFSNFAAANPIMGRPMPFRPTMPIWGSRPPLTAVGAGPTINRGSLGGVGAPPVLGGGVPPMQAPLWGGMAARPALPSPAVHNNLRLPVGGVNAFAMR